MHLVQWCNTPQLCSLSWSPGISRAISGRDGNSSALTCILGKESRWRQGHIQNIFLLKGPPTPYKRGIRSGHKHHCGKGVSCHVSYLLINAFFLGEDSVQGCKTPRLQLVPRHRGAQPIISSHPSHSAQISPSATHTGHPGSQTPGQTCPVPACKWRWLRCQTRWLGICRCYWHSLYSHLSDPLCRLLDTRAAPQPGCCSVLGRRGRREGQPM